MIDEKKKKYPQDDVGHASYLICLQLNYSVLSLFHAIDSRTIAHGTRVQLSEYTSHE